MKEICLKATIENMKEVFDFIETELAGTEGCSRADILKIHMMVDELFVNVASYAYGEDEGDVTVGVDIDGDLAIISFTDSGVPYNPLNQAAPNVELATRDRKKGGLGVYMVRNTVDDIQYEYRDGKNIVRIYKKVGA